MAPATATPRRGLGGRVQEGARLLSFSSQQQHARTHHTRSSRAMAAAMALQVMAGGGCCCQRPVLGAGRRRLAVARAVASDAAAKVSEEEGKVRLGGSEVAVSKLGIGAWSWGDTTYWNDSEWDGTHCLINQSIELFKLVLFVLEKISSCC